MPAEGKHIAARRRGVSFRELILAVLLVVGGAVGCGDDEPLGGPGPSGPVGPADDVGPSDDVEGGIAGSGSLVVDTRGVEGFDQLVLAGEGSVAVTFGDSEALVVETDDNLIGLIETTVGDGVLEIRTAIGVDIAPTHSVEYRVTATDLVAVTLAGAGSIEVESWSVDQPRVELSGAGHIRIPALDANVLEVEHNGVGSITVAGVAIEQDIVISGVGEYDATDLESQIVSITAAGASGAQVWAKDTLAVTASDNATVGYFGSPDLTQDLDDLASIESLGTR